MTVIVDDIRNGEEATTTIAFSVLFSLKKAVIVYYSVLLPSITMASLQ